ncbi:hypothetical protein C8R47DRAFT_1320347 [Mycena vitilis]|nr:hypothetical protein C8R47DRAFT_1320347 [Mycena vitilis]
MVNLRACFLRVVADIVASSPARLLAVYGSSLRVIPPILSATPFHIHFLSLLTSIPHFLTSIVSPSTSSSPLPSSPLPIVLPVIAVFAPISLAVLAVAARRRRTLLKIHQDLKTSSLLNASSLSVLLSSLTHPNVHHPFLASLAVIAVAVAVHLPRRYLPPSSSLIILVVVVALLILAIVVLLRSPLAPCRLKYPDQYTPAILDVQDLGGIPSSLKVPQDFKAARRLKKLRIKTTGHWHAQDPSGILFKSSRLQDASNLQDTASLQDTSSPQGASSPQVIEPRIKTTGHFGCQDLGGIPARHQGFKTAQRPQ